MDHCCRFDPHLLPCLPQVVCAAGRMCPGRQLQQIINLQLPLHPRPHERVDSGEEQPSCWCLRQEAGDVLLHQPQHHEILEHHHEHHHQCAAILTPLVAEGRLPWPQHPQQAMAVPLHSDRRPPDQASHFDLQGFVGSGMLTAAVTATRRCHAECCLAHCDVTTLCLRSAVAGLTKTS